MNKRRFFLFLFNCVSVLAFAQAGKPLLKGFVYDAIKHVPLKNVKVYHFDAKKVSLTRDDGSFLYNAGKTQKLSFSLLGYHDYKRRVSPKDTLVKVFLQPLSEVDYQLKTATVTNKSKQKELRHLRDVEDMTINAGRKTEVVVLKDMLVNKATNNARQVFSKVVGLTIDEGSDGGLQLNIGGRGLNPNRSANFNTRQNGYDISADVLGYPESYYTPADNGVKEIQIVRGAASLQYGTQFGGMVNFKMRDPGTKPFAMRQLLSYGSHQLISSFTDFNGALGKFSYYAYFDYKKGNGYRPNSRFSAYNTFVNLNYQQNEHNSYHLDWVKFHYLAQQPGGLTDWMFYQNPKQSNRKRNWFRVDWNILNLRYEHLFSPSSRFSVNLFGLLAERSALGFRSYRVSDADVADMPRDLLIGKFRNWGAEARFIRNYHLSHQNNVLLMGMKYYQSRNLSDQGAGDTTRFAHFSFENERYPDYPKVSHFVYPNLNLAFFAENIFHLTRHASLTPGFRFEKIRTRIEGQYSRVNKLPNGIVQSKKVLHDYQDKPRYIALFGLGFSYRRKGQELYANLSQNYRSVTFSDIHSVTPGFSISPTITDEKGYSSDVGLRGSWKKQLQYDMSVYALYYGDKIGEYYRINPAYQTVERYRDNVGTALTYGFEAFVNWDINAALIHSKDLKLSTYVNASFTQGKYLASKVPNIKGNRVEFVPFLNLHCGIEAGYKKIGANLLFSFLSAQFSDATNQPQRKTDNSGGILGEIPAYYVADLNLRYQLTPHFEILASLQNLTDHPYFTRRATGYPGPGIIPSDPFNFALTLNAHF